jgi:DNA-binding MarR family transcriptional regulator
MKLAIVTRQLRAKFDQKVEQAGVTQARWIMIAEIANAPGATQRVIANKLGVTEVTAGRLIDQLCADGYLERRENPDDRRAYCVSLGPASESVIDQLRQIAEVFEQEVFAGFTSDDLEKFDSLLEMLASNAADGRDRRNDAVSPAL